MKILVVCQHYWPEPYPLTAVCEALAARGHKVDVVTDVPNYPLGKIYPGYRLFGNEPEERNGVRIFRCFTVPRGNNVIFRVLNYYSYSLSSAVFVRKLDDDYDVIFANQSSPIMMVRAAAKYRRKHNKKMVLYCMDLWPASLAAGGLTSGPAYNYYLKVSQNYYKQADRILVTSRMFTGYLKEVIGIDENVIDYLPQFADGAYSSLPVRKMGETVNLTFAGNVGKAQNLDLVLKAAEILQKQSAEKKVIFNIIGDGSEKDRLQALAQEKGLENVVFHGRLSQEELLPHYQKADAMLLTLTSNPVIALTLPAKTQGYMAAGKPIIAAASGEIPRVIAEAQCGYCVDPEDAEGMAEAIRKFVSNGDTYTMGEKARSYYNAHFEKEHVMDVLERHLKENC